MFVENGKSENSFWFSLAAMQQFTPAGATAPLKYMCIKHNFSPSIEKN